MTRVRGSFRPPEAIGLDLDNTLVQGTDYRYHAPRWRYAVEKAIGLADPEFRGLSAEQWAALKEQCFGRPQVESVQTLLKLLNTAFGVTSSAESLTASAMEALQGMEPACGELTQGVVTFLLDMRRAGVRLGVATSSDGAFARWILERAGITSFIDAIVPADHPNLRGRYKPGPGPWQELWRELQVTNSGRVVVVEDNQDALLGAMASHRRVAGVIIAPQGRTEPLNRQAPGAPGGAGRILYRRDFSGLADEVLRKERRTIHED